MLAACFLQSYRHSLNRGVVIKEERKIYFTVIKLLRNKIVYPLEKNQTSE